MKNTFIVTFLIASITVTFSQQKKVKLNGNEILTIDLPEYGKLENGIYTCNLFEWKINIPENYNVTDLKRTEELENKGYEATKNANPDVKVNPIQLS